MIEWLLLINHKFGTTGPTKLAGKRGLELALAKIRTIWLRFCASIMVMVVPIILFAGGATAAQESAVAEPSLPAIAFVARLVGDANRARYIIDFDRKVSSDIYFLDNPRRLIIDLPQTIFSLEAESTQSPSPLASGISYDVRRGRKARITISLNEPVSIGDSHQKQVQGTQRNRLLVDIVKTSQEQFAKLAREDQDDIDLSTRDEIPDPTAVKKRVVVIDPGHGGIDGGAIGHKRVVEKNVVLKFAQILKQELQLVDNMKVVLTRDSDIFVPLTERVEIAREKHADLFISVHADSLRQGSIRGATIYTLSKDGSDAISRRLASEQNRADLVAGLDLPVKDTKVTDILIDLTRRETESFSKRFANLLVTRLKDQIRLINNPIRSADFFVLKAPEIPAILLELGYLSNKEDEKLMTREDWHRKAAQTTRKAIEQFFQMRTIGINQ